MQVDFVKRYNNPVRKRNHDIPVYAGKGAGMNDINIAGTILSKRRERGMTQDDLAVHIGVSKASVSKWETGDSLR